MSREAANDASTIPTCKAALPRLWNPLPPHPRTTRMPSAGARFREPMAEGLQGLASTFRSTVRLRGKRRRHSSWMRCKEQGQDETWPRPADGATPNTTLQAGPLTFEMVTLLLPIIAQNLLGGGGGRP